MKLKYTAKEKMEAALKYHENEIKKNHNGKKCDCKKEINKLMGIK